MLVREERIVKSENKQRGDYNLREKYGSLILIILFGVYLFLQHRMIGMYYDDFGNASLSYGYDSSQIAGTNYSIKDLFMWAKYIYFNWGGRIIYALALIPLLKPGAHLFMMLQVVIILLLFYAMYKMVKRFSSNTNGCIAILMFILSYSLLKDEILTMGIYWASASVLYVWPVLFFVLLILHYGNLEKKINTSQKLNKMDYIGLLILVPLVTLSQEQVGGSLIVWLIFNVLINHYKVEKKFAKLDIITIGYTLVTFGIFFAAPGNWNRLATNEAYASKSFIEKIIYSFPRILQLLTSDSLKYFNILLLIVGICMIFELKRKMPKWYIAISGLMLVPFAVVEIVGLKRSMHDMSVLAVVAFAIFLVDMFFLLLFYLLKRSQLKFISLMLAAVASVFCLIFSPAFAARSCLPYIFICMILVAIVIGNTLREIEKSGNKYILMIVLAFVAVLGIRNLQIVYQGYEENYAIDKYNFEKLREYDGKENTIYLLTYPNSKYRAQMPCDAGYASIESWMKEYFNIPENVSLRWKTLEEYMEYAKKAEIEVTYGDGFYQEEGDYRWAKKSATLLIENKSSEKQAVFHANVSGRGDEEANIKVSCNGEEIFAERAAGGETEITVDLTLKEGENLVVLETDGNKIDSGQDQRELFMKVQDAYIEER